MSIRRVLPNHGSAPDGGSTAIVRIPYIFSQDSLLNTDEFLKEAERRGHQLKHKDLQFLYQYQLLVPLFRIDDVEIDARKIEVPGLSERNSRGRAIDGARVGALVDCAQEEYSDEWPFELVMDGKVTRWANRYFYSQWQLADLNHALKNYYWVRDGKMKEVAKESVLRDRHRTLALVALSSLYLSAITGQVAGPPDGDFDGLGAFIDDADVLELLQVSGFDKMNLLMEAKALLSDAKCRDPMNEWWPLIRHAKYNGWKKLGGIPLDCLWQRIAAEVLLRAHEDLASKGLVDDLPDLTGVQSWDPLLERITPRQANSEPLALELAKYGLSPHPRVLLLLEGQTELVHIPVLLEKWGLNKFDRVRIQNCRGADVNPQLISRFAITPQVGSVLSGIPRLIPPTALFIAMDPEGRFWRNPEKREKKKRAIQTAIREDVEAQGHTITDEELDFIVNVFVWGEDSYELANFTENELVFAVTQLATEQTNPLVASGTWEADLRIAIGEAQIDHKGLKKMLGPLGVRENKKDLARILLPLLLDKYERELEADAFSTPVFEMIHRVRNLHALMSGGMYSLQTLQGANESVTAPVPD